MKFMTMVKTTKAGGPPPQALMEAIAVLGMEAARAGVLVEQGGLMGKEHSAFLAIRGGKVMVTDGPFAETKELVGGYAVYDLPSRDDAIAWSQRFADLHVAHWPGWEGDIEVRQIM